MPLNSINNELDSILVKEDPETYDLKVTEETKAKNLNKRYYDKLIADAQAQYGELDKRQYDKLIAEAQAQYIKSMSDAEAHCSEFHQDNYEKLMADAHAKYAKFVDLGSDLTPSSDVSKTAEGVETDGDKTSKPMPESPEKYELREIKLHGYHINSAYSYVTTEVYKRRATEARNMIRARLYAKENTSSAASQGKPNDMQLRFNKFKGDYEWYNRTKEGAKDYTKE